MPPDPTVPDIRPGYPSAGKRLGPMWEAIYNFIPTTTAIDYDAILTQFPDYNRYTVQTLMQQATSVGLFQRTGTRNHPFFRRMIR